MTNNLWTNYHDNIFFMSKKLYDKKSCIRETLSFLTNGDRSFKENIFELFGVAFDQVKAFLVLQKNEKLKSLKWNISTIGSSLAKRVLGLLTRTMFNLQKWEFCKGTDILQNRKTNTHRKFDQYVYVYFHQSYIGTMGWGATLMIPGLKVMSCLFFWSGVQDVLSRPSK